MDKAIESQETLAGFLLTSNLRDDSPEQLENAEIEHAALMKETHERILTLRGDVVSSAASVKCCSAKSECQQWVNLPAQD